jgi:pimeloyl-ACP methyl ester carboxylesterase
MQTVSVHGVRLEYVRLAPARPHPAAPAILLLHEGLGSVSLWRDFPQALADACGCEAVAYSRQGHGGSDPSTGPRTRRYLHHEAVDVLPALIDALELERPLLFGHSDGATIALLCAGETSTPNPLHPPTAGRRSASRSSFRGPAWLRGGRPRN